MAVELTKELIERVAQRIECELTEDMRNPSYVISPLSIRSKVQRLLELELLPLHTFTFEVRGKDRAEAVRRLVDAAENGYLFARTDITLRDES